MSANALYAAHIDFFPERSEFFSASALEFRQYLYTGAENGRVVNHGNLGVEFPAIGFSPRENRRCLAGAAAAVHLVMFPNNMKFAVDNFYATLALYANCFKSEKISCRLYPVYHVSGHLGDGAKNDSALTNARAVSSEMARFEMAFSPRTWINFSAGYGYYYHVCSQQGLTDRFDCALQWQPSPDGWFQPFLTLSGQFIHISQWRAGFDSEAGVKLIGRRGQCRGQCRGRGIGISFRYFNRMDPGYYFDDRKKSVGVQLDFLL